MDPSVRPIHFTKSIEVFCGALSICGESFQPVLEDRSRVQQVLKPEHFGLLPEGEPSVGLYDLTELHGIVFCLVQSTVTDLFKDLNSNNQVETLI